MTVHPLDVVLQALEALGARPMRVALTVIGVVLGTASMLVSVGLASAGRAAVLAAFDRDEATTVVATRPDGAIDAAAIARVRHLRGVVGADAVRLLPGREATVVHGERAVPPSAAVASGGPDLAEVAGAAVARGRGFDRGHERRRSAVALVGADAARALGIHGVDGSTSVLIDGRAVVVIGILGPARRWPALDDLVLVPVAFAHHRLSAPERGASAVVRTELGAGATIGRQLPTAILPGDEAQIEVAAPPDLSRRRTETLQHLDAMAATVGIVGLVAGALAIVNTMLIGVLERWREIALRRALGASRSAVASQFLVESSAMGLLGGGLGATAATAILLATCAWRGWPLLLPGGWIAGSPLAGAAVGLVAGAVPAWRAAAVHPALVLRSPR